MKISRLPIGLFGMGQARTEFDDNSIAAHRGGVVLIVSVFAAAVIGVPHSLPHS